MDRDAKQGSEASTDDTVLATLQGDLSVLLRAGIVYGMALCNVVSVQPFTIYSILSNGFPYFCIHSPQEPEQGANK